jgi:hypothetical protein
LSKTATVPYAMAELVDRILSAVPTELPVLLGFHVCCDDALISLMKSILAQNIQSKAHCGVCTIKLFQQAVLAGSTIAA